MKPLYNCMFLVFLLFATTTALTVRKRISLLFRLWLFPTPLLLAPQDFSMSHPSPSVVCNINQQKKEIFLKDREDRVGSLNHQLKVLERQMEDHTSGKKVISHERLSSLKKRMLHYNDQLVDLSKELSEEVRTFRNKCFDTEITTTSF